MTTGLSPYKMIQDGDGSAHMTYIEVEIKTQQQIWKERCPNEIWIIDTISPTLVYINSSKGNLYPIKRFRSQISAEKWLINQGADYLTRSDYEYLIKTRKGKSA